MLDNNGYPSEEELKTITKLGNLKDSDALIDYLNDRWNWEDICFKYDGKNLILHTGGWSGNEDMIDALYNTLFWHRYWKSSQRGGHFKFTILD